MRTPIAIIGMGCRFPGAQNPRQFWRLLESGKDAIGPLTEDRWQADGPPIRGGFLSGIDRFDPAFFGISPEEACAMDPQQRLMLEVAWEAMEDAAILPSQLAGTDTAVYVGVASLNYGSMVQNHPDAIGRFTNTGIGGGVCANRISYSLDLHGPSFIVDAACASSLLAVHMACQAIWNGDAKLAFAGGVNAILLPGPGLAMARSGMMAPDGIIRVFDAKASGWLRGEGAGIVLLKALPQAIAACDPIYALIRGTAVNHNGRSNGLSGPSRQAQESVIRQALSHAEVKPAAVQYIEAHSNGTLIGDATELAALTGVLKEGRGAAEPCMVGSLKANIGHLEAAAGIAGLMKVALMLKRRRLVPTLHFQQPNPHAGANLPLRVQAEAEPWPGDRQLIAGVSAASYAGANVHVVLSEACEAPATSQQSGSHAIQLSGRTPDGLRAYAADYAQFLSETPAVSLADVCHTMQAGRAQMRHRLTVVAENAESMAAQLRDAASRDSLPPAGSPTPSIGRRISELPTYPFQRESYWLPDAQAKPLKIAGEESTLRISAKPAPAPALANRSPDAIIPARNETERRLIAVWEKTLNVSPISIRDSFFDLGGTSALALQLFANVEQEFSRALPLAKLYSAPTIEQISPLLLEPNDSCHWDTVVALNERGTLPPLFFVPGLGGHAFDLRVLARQIGEDQPVNVLHPQGLDPGQVPLSSVEEMAAAFVAEVRRRQPQGPYRIGGYSFGGSVAFEMACLLRESGQDVASLILLDAYGPAAFQKRSLPRRLATHAQMLLRMDRSKRRQYLSQRVNGVWRRLHRAALGGAAPAAPGGSAVVNAVQRVVDANAQAWREYRPRKYAGRAILFRAHQRDEGIRAFTTCDQFNGWGECCSGGVEVITLSCDHLEVFHQPYISQLAGQIRSHLDSVRPRPQPRRMSA